MPLPTSPVAMTSTISETPTALDNLEAVHVALKKPVMAIIARNELAPPIVPAKVSIGEPRVLLYKHGFFGQFHPFLFTFACNRSIGCVASQCFPYKNTPNAFIAVESQPTPPIRHKKIVGSQGLPGAWRIIPNHKYMLDNHGW